MQISVLESQRLSAVEIEDLRTEDEFVFGLHGFGLGLLHARFGIVEIEDRRAACRGFLLFVGECHLAEAEAAWAELYLA